MSKYAVVDRDGSVGDERYDTETEAIEKAKELVTEEPDSEVDVVMVTKTVSSTLKIDVLDA